MSAPSFRERIIGILADLGEIDDAGQAALLAAPEQDIEFVTIEMDSLTALDLCVNLEDATNRTIEPADLVSYPSINRLAAFLDAGGGGAR
ncbi:MAG: acyl carrier protein [Dongiaceae bacterium]